MYFITAIQDILITPKEFFHRKHTEGDKYGMGGLFFYAFILSVVSGLIRYGYLILIHASEQLESDPHVMNVVTLTHLSTDSLIILATIVLQILIFIGLFIIPLFIHLGMKMMKGTGSLRQTYQAYIFGSTPFFIFGTFPILGFAALVYGLYIKIIGLSEFHQLRFDYSIVGYVIGRIIGFISSIVIGAVCLVLLVLILLPFLKQHQEFFHTLNQQQNTVPTFYQTGTSTTATSSIKTI